jgi:hypothetical protein
VLEYLKCSKSLAMNDELSTAMMEPSFTDCPGDEKGIDFVIV